MSLHLLETNCLEILNMYSDELRVFCLLGYNAVYSFESYPKFQRNIGFEYVEYVRSLDLFLDTELGGDLFL
jgi:hypothetical protein